MRIATLIGAAGLVLSTAAGAQVVTYDYDKSADFGAFETYDWVPGTNLQDELNHKRVVDAVSAQLASKGLRETGSSPDLLVAYHVGVASEVQVSSSGWSGYRPARWGTARVEEVMVGMLVVEITDARTGTVVWRGIATKDLDVKAGPEKREKNINKAAEKLFRNYPPAADK